MAGWLAKRSSRQPGWIVKTPRNSKLERIGAAWDREKDGGICIRLVGDQLVTGDLYLFPNTPMEEGAR
ncbi:MAG TPA: hypothetical protein VG889_15055 [Rhizomicrobium sp.]|nr:hypothetical protein [Rhizomicrobium sp.]